MAEAAKTAKKASKEEKAPQTGAFAVIATGGKQYIVSEGEALKVEKLDGQTVGDTVTFDKVLLMDDGTDTVVGTPYIEGAQITAKLEEEGKYKKVTVIKYKAKSRYFKKRGHRQPYSKVIIGKVS